MSPPSLHCECTSVPMRQLTNALHADAPPHQRAPRRRRTKTAMHQDNDAPMHRHTDTPTHQRADTPTSRHAHEPTPPHMNALACQCACTNARRHTDTPTHQHARISTCPHTNVAACQSPGTPTYPPVPRTPHSHTPSHLGARVFKYMNVINIITIYLCILAT
jgi:hypothetical protein